MIPLSQARPGLTSEKISVALRRDNGVVEGPFEESVRAALVGLDMKWTYRSELLATDLT